MRARKVRLSFLTATILAIIALLAAPAIAQQTLYDNGPDGDVGYYHVNFGSAVSNSFELSQAATITSVILTLYDVDDRNIPQHLKWTITTEPFGGDVKGSGFVGLNRLQPPYLTKFLFFAWQMSFPVPNLALPPGTYYLQIQDVVTQWDTWAFWAQSAGGNSQGYYEAVGQNGGGMISPVASETFVLSGKWITEQAE
jgi:hypothetical protein